MADNFKLDVDADGIALITWDMPGRSMNVIDLAVIEELSAIVEKIAADAAIKGAVITSGKDTFCAGADLTHARNADAHVQDHGQGQGRGGRGHGAVHREPQAVAALPAHRDLRQAVRRPRSTAPRWAAASSSASPATSASPPTTARPASACPR